MLSRSHILLLLVLGCLAHLVSFGFLTASVLKHPRTPVNALGITDYAGTDHEQLIKRLRSAQSVDEALFKSFDPLLFLCVFHFVVCDSLFTYYGNSHFCIFRLLILLLNNLPGQLMTFREPLLVPCIRDPL